MKRHFAGIGGNSTRADLLQHSVQIVHPEKNFDWKLGTVLATGRVASLFVLARWFGLISISYIWTVLSGLQTAILDAYYEAGLCTWIRDRYEDRKAFRKTLQRPARPAADGDAAILSNRFRKHHVDRPLTVEQLTKCKRQDNLEFLQWTKRYWDQYYPGGDYDAVARRNGAGATAPASAPTSARTSTRQRTRARGYGRRQYVRIQPGHADVKTGFFSSPDGVEIL
ncbi:microtubule integrity protein mal3 [Elasticomyces elasticus]|nr:microtubule integrity protein mal3 [Elasticomyces elasticus]